MEAKIRFQLALAALCMSALGAACAGVIERAGTPGAWDGKFISCHAPEATLGVVGKQGSESYFSFTVEKTYSDPLFLSQLKDKKIGKP